MTDDTEIVGSIRRNPVNGFRLLIRERWEPVYWHIRRLVIHHADAQDATQETFIRVFQGLVKFKEESSLNVWIYRIATNEALRLIGKRRRDIVSIDDSDSSGARILADEEYVDFTDLEAVKLQNAILSLPTKQQLAFNMRYYDEMDYDEIARITDSTPSSVKANYHLAKEKIIRYMNLKD